MASLSAMIGTVTLIFTTTIFEYSYIWFIADVIGFLIGLFGYKRGDKNCKTGMILCAVAGFFSLGMSLIVLFFEKSILK